MVVSTGARTFPFVVLQINLRENNWFKEKDYLENDLKRGVLCKTPATWAWALAHVGYRWLAKEREAPPSPSQNPSCHLFLPLSPIVAATPFSLVATTLVPPPPPLAAPSPSGEIPRCRWRKPLLLPATWRKEEGLTPGISVGKEDEGEGGRKEGKGLCPGVGVHRVQQRVLQG